MASRGILETRTSASSQEPGLSGRAVASLDQFRDWAAREGGGLVYAGPDPHHAIGLDQLAPGLRVVCVDAPPALALLAAAGFEVLALDTVAGRPGTAPRSLPALLGATPVRAFLDLRPPVRLVVFKTSAVVEEHCRRNGWQLLAASAALSRRWENKVAFRELAEELGLPQPPGLVLDVADLNFGALKLRLGTPFVLQAAHGYSGNRTCLVRDEEGCRRAVAVLRAPVLRATAYIAGQPLTMNGCVTAAGVAVSAPFVQITGKPALTRYRLGSCGNDWSAAQVLDSAWWPFISVAESLGKALGARGYRGIFGVDFILGEDGRPVVIEVNPRLVASIALYTQLELIAGRLPLLARHILAFLAPDLDVAALDLHHAPVDGAQIILHNLHAYEVKVGRDLGAGVLAAADTTPPRVARSTVHVGDAAASEKLLLAPGGGRLVSAGQELGRIQARGPLATSGGRLLAGTAKRVQSVLAGMNLVRMEAPPDG